MAKTQKRTEQEVHAMIVTDAKIRLGCEDFAPEFTLHRIDDNPTRYPLANWDVQTTRGTHGWPSDCAQAFREAVTRARRKVDIAWP